MGSECAAPPSKPRTRVPPPSVVFGDARNQDLLLRINREGPIDVHRNGMFRA
jgi:hypothetical protein